MKVNLFLALLFSFSSFFAQTDTLSIYFDFDEFSISNSEIIKLDTFLNSNADSLNILGYTDFKGTNNYNNKLSQKRSNTVKNYLITKGFSSTINNCLGKGMLDSKSKIEENRTINRRVDIIYTIHKVTKPITSKPLIQLDTISIGDKLILDRMYFIGGRHYLHPKSVHLLDELLQIMNNNPNLKIEIQGHICCQPSGEGMDNDTGLRNLSVARAKYIYDYLIDNNIDSTRLSYKGFGASQLLPGTSYQDNRNRRVEILILDK